MKYRLNALPVPTTNHFHINDISLEFPKPKYHMEGDLQIEGDLSSIVIEKEFLGKKLTSKMGFEVDSYQEIRITIPKGVHVAKPIVLSHHFSSREVLFTKIILTYLEDSSCDFTFTFSSDDTSFLYLVEEAHLGVGAEGNVLFSNFLGDTSYCFYAQENVVEEGAKLTHTLLDLGGSVRLYHGFGRTLASSMNQLRVLYLGDKESTLDFHFYYQNEEKHSTNSILVEGALKDSSCKNFRGTIDFLKGCSSSVGEENENCILLSDTCRSRSLPQMLCHEEDVVGTHGVSSGHISQDTLFYLMSRGLSEKEAYHVILMGNFSRILKDLPEEVVSQVIDKIEEMLA